MDLNFMNEYVVAVVFALCLCVGYMLKHAVTTDKINKYIPLIMGILGVILNVWMNQFAFNPEILLGGLFSGLASTGFHQVFSQLIEKKTE
jgi:hypothetical protein